MLFVFMTNFHLIMVSTQAQERIPRLQELGSMLIAMLDWVSVWLMIFLDLI